LVLVSEPVWFRERGDSLLAAPEASGEQALAGLPVEPRAALRADSASLQVSLQASPLAALPNGVDSVLPDEQLRD
jgi:hypothetical protein